MLVVARYKGAPYCACLRCGCRASWFSKNLAKQCKGPPTHPQATARGDILKLARGVHPNGEPVENADDVVEAIGRLRSERSGVLGHIPASSFSVRGTLVVPPPVAQSATLSHGSSGSSAAQPARSDLAAPSAVPSAFQAMLARVRAKSAE